MDDNSLSKENSNKGNLKQKDKKIKNKKQKQKRLMPEWLAWGLTVLFLSFTLTILFSFLTEISIKHSPVYICIVVLIVLLALNIGCDMLATAILTCNQEVFHAMASNKIRGSKRAVTFCKHAPRLGSVFADIIGDICGIVSGAAGAVLVVYIAANGGDTIELIASIGVNAVIAALTVGGKAFFKYSAKKYNKQIVLCFAKFTILFKKEK